MQNKNHSAETPNGFLCREMVDYHLATILAMEYVPST
jgi:hypothetical protein